ncbi:MAG: hypothetical protein FJY36_00535 [Betaproteobacteria bacterium]|nr:hypothetical protein [Betaproteobacteria bacterium]
MVMLLAHVLNCLLGLMKPTQACVRMAAKPVLDTAECLQQWTHLSTPLHSPHPRALNPLPEPALG